MKVSGGGGGVGGGGELVRNSLRTFRENLGRMGTDLTSFRTVLLDGLASECNAVKRTCVKEELG